MRQWQQNTKRKSRIEIIPMIDVMMFLLVFFVLMSLNVIPALGVKTQPPHSSQAQSLKTPVKQVVVTLAKEGRIVIENQDVALQAIAATLRSKATAGEKLAVVVNSDKGAEVQLLIDVMDELKSKGFESVALAARDRG